MAAPVTLTSGAGVEAGTSTNPVYVTPVSGGVDQDVNLVATGGNILAADDAAAGTTVPVPVGGIYNSTLPSYTNGDRTQAQFTSRGELRSQIVGEQGTGGDGQSNTLAYTITSGAGTGRLFTGAQFAFNGTTWDRQRGDTNGNVNQPYAMAASRWVYAAPSGGIDNSNTAVTVISAAGSGVRNYITGLQIAHATLSATTEFAIRDGAGGTVLWRTVLHTTALPLTNIDFAVPLKGTANTLLEIITLTAVTGDVLVSLQGFQGA